jgi:DNA-binding NtrC family response regulator
MPMRQRPTVLVVEDEFIIALDLSETVEDLGYTLEGPFPDKRSAFQAIEDDMPDAAILDVCIRDGEVFPLADALAQAGVSLIFHSGHVNEEEVAERYPGAWACAKPCPPARLIDALQEALERRIKLYA